MKMMLNGKPVSIPGTYTDESLFSLLRDHFHLRGPRFGCGVGACGACTVVVDGDAVRSCITPTSAVDGTTVTTLEGLVESGILHPIQQAWIAESVPQCGYCQNGQIMTAFAILARDSDAKADTLAEAMDQILCRCGTQQRIRRAVRQAQQSMKDSA